MVDRWDGTVYRRVLALSEGSVAFSVTQADPSDASALTVALDKRVGGNVEGNVRASIERLLELRVELAAFYRMARADSVLGPLSARFQGVKPPRFPTVYESLLNAVAVQQLSLESRLELA